MTGRAVPRISAVVALAAALGCGSSSPSGKRPDGGTDAAAERTPLDAGACACSVDGAGVLHMSFACYCAQYDCSAPAAVCAAPAGFQSWKIACGLTVFSTMTPGGPFISVYDDDTGALVGAQISSDTADYVCPSDPTLTGFSVKAGQFPDATCSVQTCACDGGGACSATDAAAVP